MGAPVLDHFTQPAAASPARQNRAPRRMVKLSYADVAGCSAMVGFGETYFSAFALAAGLSEVESGLIATVPFVFGGVLQLLAPLGPKWAGSYRRWVVATVVLQGLAFVPLCAGAVNGHMSTVAAFAAVSLYFAAGMGSGAAWTTWIDAVIPPRVFGGFLATRARLTQLAAFAAFFAGGYALNQLDQRGAALRGFFALFALAGAARLFSGACLYGHADLAYRDRPLEAAKPVELLKRFLNPKKSRFLLFLLANQVAVNVGGPFFAPFFLIRRHFSYAEYTAILSASFLAKIAFYPWMGKLARRFGAYRTLWVSALLVAPLPFFWFCTPNVFAISLVQIAAGILWGSFELAQTMLIFARLEPAERLGMMTVYTFLNAIAVVAGSLAGGAILALTGPEWGYGMVFSASAALRFLSVGSLFPLRRARWPGRR